MHPPHTAATTTTTTTPECSLQGQEVPQKAEYKYLGVVMERGATWHRWSDERVARGRRCLPKLWYSGARQGALSTRTANHLMEVMMWPTVGYGGQLARPNKAEVAAGEVLQNEAGRQILGTGRRTPIDAMRGELGWIPLEARRAQQQLLFFHRLQWMRPDSITGRVFHHRMHSFRERAAAGLKSHGVCGVVRDLMLRYAISTDRHFVITTPVDRWSWRSTVEAAVTRREASDWQLRLEVATGATPTATQTAARDEETSATATREAGESHARAWYRGLKTQWGAESYLVECRSPAGRRILSQLRTRTAPLNYTQPRYYPSNTPQPRVLGATWTCATTRSMCCSSVRCTTTTATPSL
jgi:hypothetical protein